MLSIGNKKYRNLQEQVGYNTECIKKLDEYLDGIAIEDKLVVIDTDSGTFTDEELVILSGPLAFISNGSRVWMKDSETLVEFVYKAIDIKADEVGSAYFNIGGSKIVVNRETGAFNTSSDTIITTYSKDQIDSIIANIMAVKADKTELTAGLALKANVAGQAFTGAITAPSIIQTMTGFTGVITNIPDYTKSDAYLGVVQTGNKVTFVVSIDVIKGAGAGSTLSLAYFGIPAEIGAKLFPSSVGGANYLDNRKLNCFDALQSSVEVNAWVSKNSGTMITFACIGSPLVEGTKYHIRYEATFLLSDNLAS